MLFKETRHQEIHKYCHILLCAQEKSPSGIEVVNTFRFFFYYIQSFKKFKSVHYPNC